MIILLSLIFIVAAESRFSDDSNRQLAESAAGYRSQHRIHTSRSTNGSGTLSEPVISYNDPIQYYTSYLSSIEDIDFYRKIPVNYRSSEDTRPQGKFVFSTGQGLYRGKMRRGRRPFVRNSFTNKKIYRRDSILDNKGVKKSKDSARVNSFASDNQKYTKNSTLTRSKSLANSTNGADETMLISTSKDETALASLFASSVATPLTKKPVL